MLNLSTFGLLWGNRYILLSFFSFFFYKGGNLYEFLLLFCTLSSLDNGSSLKGENLLSWEGANSFLLELAPINTRSKYIELPPFQVYSFTLTKLHWYNPKKWKSWQIMAKKKRMEKSNKITFIRFTLGLEHIKSTLGSPSFLTC